MIDMNRGRTLLLAVTVATLATQLEGCVFPVVVGAVAGGAYALALMVLTGPTADPSGERNLFGSLRRVMAKCGYSSVKEFQKAELIVTGLR